MILVDRRNFLRWVDGDLLIRDRKGRCLVGDHIDHEKAQAAMDRGEVIGLTNQGQVVSTMRLTPEGYVEEAMDLL
jgi:hypothetical protein